MDGMDRNTGKTLSGIDHLKQSIQDILTTPIGTRVMRRDYGSELFSLIDAPLNKATKVDIYSATADALAKWESRFSLQQVDVFSEDSSSIAIYIKGVYLPTGENVVMDGIIIE